MNFNCYPLDSTNNVGNKSLNKPFDVDVKVCLAE